MKKSLRVLSLLLVVVLTLSFLQISVFATPAVDLYGIQPKEEKTEEKDNKENKKEEIKPAKQPVLKEEIVEKEKIQPYIPQNESNIKLVINKSQVIFPDQQPILIDGRTYVPVRFLAENLGATVEWDDKNQVVIITNNGLQKTSDASYYAKYYLKLGEPQMVFIAYDKSTDYPASIEIFDIPQAPFITDKNRTMLPFRFVSELLGAFIYYDDSTHTAIAEYDPMKKENTIYPIPILSTITQDYFHDELMSFRLLNRPDYVQNVEIMNIRQNNELMAAATWKALDLFKTYDHTNSDGTRYWSRFFQLYMANKYNGETPGFTGENISPINFSAPLGIKLINANQTLQGKYYYCMNDVDAVLDDAEYWYQFLEKGWGIKMVPLNETSNLTYNGKSYSKYKMNSQYYVKISGVNFHSFSIIKHWTPDVYKSLVRQQIIIWGNSFGHKNNLISPSGEFGYGIKIINEQGYGVFAKK